MKKILIAMIVSAFVFIPQLLKAEIISEDIFFQESLLSVTKSIQKFEEKIKATRLDTIIAEPLPLIGDKTYGDLILFQQFQIRPLPEGIKEFNKIFPKVTEWLNNEYQEFYRRIYPILKEIALKAKDSPVRLGSVSVNITPLGIGGSLTIDINYGSSVFKE